MSYVQSLHCLFTRKKYQWGVHNRQSRPPPKKSRPLSRQQQIFRKFPKLSEKFPTFPKKSQFFPKNPPISIKSKNKYLKKKKSAKVGKKKWADFGGCVGGSKISKCLRMLTVVSGGGFGLTLTQNNSNFYNLDTEKVNNMQLNTKSQLYPKKTTSM